MGFTRSRKTAAAALAGAVLLGGGIAAVAPAAAEDSAQFAATNWKKVWKNDLQQYADKRYYTKKKSDKKYATKTTLESYYTKAQSDATYATKALTYSKTDSDARYYTKAQADAKYAPYPSLIRGNFIQLGDGAAEASGTGISFGVTFSAAPIAHYIKVGDPVPVGCSGTVTAPNASAGHLCVFEGAVIGPVSANRGICNASGDCPASTNAFGANIYAQASGAGLFQVFGSWAARPTAVAANPALAGSGGQNQGPAGGTGIAP